MKYVVAVSGGVDSMVLMHMLHKLPGAELVVAHFDHGIRDDSHVDAQLVAETAKKYGLTFETKREELGRSAGEAVARERRYAFLRDIAKKHQAQLVTAHHMDDLVETIAINLSRGTGWRGLAAFDSEITRPLVDVSKKVLLEYAKTHDITWREDSTNAQDVYLRNKLRHKTKELSLEQKRELRTLHSVQRALKVEIEKEVLALIGEGPEYSRYLFTHLKSPVALECLRIATKGALTRPQMVRLLHAIKVTKPGYIYEAGAGVKVRFTPRQFSL